MTISNKELQINEQITNSEVRLIGEDGSQVGVVPLAQAMKMASSADLDLVKIADKKNDAPVCKIMDYGKYKFDMAKKEKESKKKQHVASVKEIRLSMNIGENDLQVKANNAKRFAEDGNKIKVSMRLKGREMGHTDIAKELMRGFAEKCQEFVDLSKLNIAVDGRSLVMLLAPKSTKSNSSKKSSKKGSEGGKKETAEQTLKPEENVQVENS